ncbi:ubiquinol-cytochrome C chaperone family protein [Acuticoccus sp. MNP-M23]|uniref:ubiquinol-cytochrome C chaperone family protein n=1 Tax=Acuticoccus sp. MNP-M23 TaxID=3072793 RepID=UPI0028154968|nr:ubiquinol-cytochrome C chaperone family protein [Acuticoccus sp. MNP-M23]WMS43345.1 ubiquinol-cytochrome C chaperone family protein [Acuticoccus sp. MNP-M23]
MLRFFRKKQTNPAVDRLYREAVAQARQPVFYQTFGVPDTLDGRFDMVVFHIWPLIDGLRAEDGTMIEDGQELFDTFVADMEQNLRNLGVGDNSFPKKMKAIGSAFYGRFEAYCTAKDADALAVVAARNILGDEAVAGSVQAQSLGRYGQAMREAATKTLPTEHYSYPDPVAFAPHSQPGDAA